MREHHGVGNVVLVDDHDIIEPVLDERSGELARQLHRDAVGERDHRTVRDALAGVGAQPAI